MSKLNPSSKAGFGIVEVVIAFALAAGLSLVISQILSDMSRGQRRSDIVSVRQNMMDNIRSMLNTATVLNNMRWNNNAGGNDLRNCVPDDPVATLPNCSTTYVPIAFYDGKNPPLPLPTPANSGPYGTLIAPAGGGKVTDGLVACATTTAECRWQISIEYKATPIGAMGSNDIDLRVTLTYAPPTPDPQNNLATKSFEVTQRTSMFMPAGIEASVAGGSQVVTRSGDIMKGPLTIDPLPSSLSPGQSALLVMGDIETTGSYFISDRRMKRNIFAMPYGLDTIMRLEPKKYQFIKTGKDSIGFIAQDVEALVPEVVRTNEQGIKSIQYPLMTAILAQAVKELKNHNDDLENKVVRVEKENAQLKKQLLNFEARLRALEGRLQK